MRWLFRALDFPVGVVLVTGTAIMPPPGFTLRAGDKAIIATTGLDELRNVVEVAGPLGAGGRLRCWPYGGMPEVTYGWRRCRRPRRRDRASCSSR